MNVAWNKAKPSESGSDSNVLTERKQPSMAAVRRAVASSTALETGQSVQALEQKLKATANRRFAHIKLAP